MSECARYEPSLDEIMADSTVHALMKADRVNVERLRLKLLQVASAARDRHASQAAAEPFALRPPREIGSGLSSVPRHLQA